MSKSSTSFTSEFQPKKRRVRGPAKNKEFPADLTKLALDALKDKIVKGDITAISLALNLGMTKYKAETRTGSIDYLLKQEKLDSDCLLADLVDHLKKTGKL